MAAKRLSFDERREQLLDTATAIVREEGAEALTLARVAEKAGVSKPIAYDHFETRAGLLKALYRRVDDRQLERLGTALDARARTLEDAVSLLAEAYMDCVLHVGMEFGTLTAALSTFPEAEAFLHESRERYAQIYLQAVERFTSFDARAGKTVMLGVIGAAEAIAREMAAGRVIRVDAVDATRRIMMGSIGKQ